MLKGLERNIPYSLSRYTDVPAAKWEWFRSQLDQGWFYGSDPRCPVFLKCSLDPKDVLGLIFWTKDPTNLLKDKALLGPYSVKVHVTLTGWSEVEKGAPSIDRGAELLSQTVAAFGADRVVWRFSPIPLLDDSDVLHRFERIERQLPDVPVYVSFLQENPWKEESRTLAQKQELLRRLANSTSKQVLVCQDEPELIAKPPSNLRYGVCEDGSLFLQDLPKESCGCAYSIDAFSVNESCTLGCSYCYAADPSLSPKKHNSCRKAASSDT